MTPPAPLLVIYTGGTLGMVESPAGLSPGRDIEARLHRALERLPAGRRRALPAFTLVEWREPIDSSAATPADWQRLAREIAARYRDHAGIVVLHGTDTLAWSASSLAYQLQGLDRAVVLTGAMQPLEADDSDAIDNVEAALRFAAQASLKEVAICFAGRLLRGVRARKWHTSAPAAFASPGYPPLGEYPDGALELAFEHLLAPSPAVPRFELPDYTPLSDGGVARLVLWPGIAARQVAAWLDDPALRGAVLEIWGGGNLPNDPALHRELIRAQDAGKCLLAISQCPKGRIAPGHYAAGQALAAAGVVDGGAMTPEAALTKLVHLLAQPLSDHDRRERLLTSLVGER